MANGVEVTKDNRRAVSVAVLMAITRGLEEVGLVAEGAAKRLCPVDTGRLRGSITHQVSVGEEAVYIGTNVEYAPAVEFREDVHHDVGQAHYLRDAANDNAGTYRQIIESALKSG